MVKHSLIVKGSIFISNGGLANIGPNSFVKANSLVKGTMNQDPNSRIDIKSLLISGNYNLIEFTNPDNKALLDQVLSELDRRSKTDLLAAYKFAQERNYTKAKKYFKRFTSYILQHPELITSSIQIFLQLIFCK